MANETKNNLKFWEAFRAVPEEAKRAIEDGKLKGKTDINPVWRLKVLTEQFGPCGRGWHYETVERFSDNYNGELIANVRIRLFIHPEGETPWAPIEGIGGSKIFGSGKGKFVDDEAWKMATTDAISVACKSLGIAADVYYSKDAGVNAIDNRWSKYQPPINYDPSMQWMYPQGAPQWQPPQNQQVAYPQQGAQQGVQQPYPPQGGYPQGGYPPQAAAPAQPPTYADTAPMGVQPFDENHPAVADAISRLCNFEKGSNTFQLTLNGVINELTAAGFRVFESDFIYNLTEAAQARREGRTPVYKQ